MDEDRLKRAIQLVQIAAEKDKAGDYESALQYYKSSLDNWQLVCKYQTNPLLKERLYEKMEPYVARAEAIKEYLEKQRTVPVASSTTANGIEGENNSKSEDEKLKDAMAGVVLAERPQVSWNDVAGLETAKIALQEAVTLPTRFPNLFVGKRKPWKGILLYGPPGTGKTHLARACATEASATFLSVSSADLISKWQGESEKLVRALFDTAKERSPSIIFIDEIDSLCSARSDKESESSKRVKTEFLVQMEGVETQSKDGQPAQRVLILGATNEPWALDTAIRRRFERRIYIPLPDMHARRQMFKIHIGNTPNSLTPDDLEELAKRTQGYSGADISVLVRDALFEPVRRCRLATHFKKLVINGQEYWTPCPPSDPDPTKEERSLMSIPGPQLLPAELSMWDFEAALEQSKPTVSDAELVKHQEWTKKFGLEGQ